MLHGGIERQGVPSSERPLNDTWEWDGIQWTKIDVAGPTGPRVFHAMAYDPKRRKIVIFGGSPGIHNGYLNETWEYGLPPLQLTVSAPQPDGSLEIRWTGEAPPYQLQSCSSLSGGEWQTEGGPTDALSATVQADSAAKFFRVLSRFGNPPTGDVAPQTATAFYRVTHPRPPSVYVPSSDDPRTPLPLVLLLHGYGDSGQGVENYMRFQPQQSQQASLE